MAENSKTGKRNIGIGLVGTGFMCKSHSNAYHKAGYLFWDRPYTPALVGVASSSLEKAEASAARFGYRYGCQGWEKLLADPEVALIDVCVGDSLHKRVSLEAIAAGKAVLCEKPLALSVEDAREMVEAAAKSRVVNMCGFNYRFLPAVRLAKRLIDRGVLGRLYCFDGRYCQDSGMDERVPAEKLWYVQGPKATGIANGIGSHLVDMSRFLVGDVASVSGLLKTYNKVRSSAAGDVEVKNDEEMLAVVEFKSGASGLYRASAVAGGRKNFLSWELSGSGGSLLFDIENPNILKVFLKDSPVKEVSGFTAVNVTQLDKEHPFAEYYWPRGHGIGWEDAHVGEAGHILDCTAGLAQVAPFGATFEDGLRVVEILDAARRSQASGQRVLL